MAKITLSRRTKGILCILLAALCFSAMSACVRLAGDGLPTIQKAFFRNFVALLAALALSRRKGVSWKPARKSLPALLGRSVFGTLGLLLNFYAIDRLALADANMLNKLSPFFAILFSAWLLREKPDAVQIGAVAVAFLGSLCIMKPGFQDTPFLPALAGFFGGMGAGIAYTFVRKLGIQGEDSHRIVLFFSAFSCAVCLPGMLFSHAPMSFRQLGFLMLAGLCGCVAQFAITRAYLYAPAKELSVYDYTQVIFATVWGYLLFDQVPDGLSVLGYLLVCGAGVGMFLYHKRQDRKLTPHPAK